MKEQDFLRRMMLTGLGFLDLTKEKADDMVQELVKRGEVAESDGKEYAEDLMNKAKDAEKNVKSKVEEVLSEKSYATQEEVEKLSTKLDEVLRKLGSTND